MSKKVNFTKAILSTTRPLKPGQRITLLDAKTSGLQCRITYTGVVTFSIFRRIKSRRIERITIGRFPDISIEQARDQAAKIAACIADGGNPAEVKRAHREEPTFKEVFNDYIENYAKHKKRTWKTTDVSNYKLYLEKPLGNKRLSQIVKADIAEIHSKISRQQRKTKSKDGLPQYKLTTANRVLVTVSSVFKWAMEQDLCKLNSATGIKKNPTKSRERFLQAEELARFFVAVQEEPNETLRDYIYLSLYTGARRGNVLSMRWDQISIQQKLWIIPHTKNGDPHVIPLIDEAIDVLKKRMNNGSEYVLPGRYQGHLQEPRFAWQRILKQAGIENLRLHDLRRTLGSWQAITGSSLSIIGKTLGHKSAEATAVYARLSIDPVRKSIQTATGAMLAAAGIRRAEKITETFNQKSIYKKQTVHFFIPWMAEQARSA